MSAFSIRRPGATAVWRVPALVVCVVSMFAGGCANSSGAYSSNHPAQVAQSAAVAMESDGLPVQAAPSAQIRQLPDDSSQPYSPNYGGANPARADTTQPTVKASNDAALPRNSIPSDLPPAFPAQLAAAVNGAG